MGRKNGRIRWDRGGTSGTQHGKGMKRRRDWHNGAKSDIIAGFDTTTIRDMGTGADPTLAAPVPFSGKTPPSRRRAAGGAV